MTQDVLPPFTEAGLLPRGQYAISLDRLRASHLVSGVHSALETWDAAWRAQLVENLATMVRQLWDVGTTSVYLAGSFVEDKSHPQDIDGWFSCEPAYYLSGQLAADLNARDPFGIWAWEPGARYPAPGKTVPQLPMWHRYRVELYPDYGQPFGRTAAGLLVPASVWFARTRLGEPKGILRLIKENTP